MSISCGDTSQGVPRICSSKVATQILSQKLKIKTRNERLDTRNI